MRSFFFCLVLFVTPLRFFAASHVARDTVSHSITGVSYMVPGKPAEGKLRKFKKRGIVRFKRMLSPGDRYASQSHDLGMAALVAVLFFPLLALIPSAGFLVYFAFLGIPLGVMAITRAGKAKKLGSHRKDGRVMGIVALCLLGTGLFVASIMSLILSLTL